MFVLGVRGWDLSIVFIFIYFSREDECIGCVAAGGCCTHWLLPAVEDWRSSLWESSCLMVEIRLFFFLFALVGSFPAFQHDRFVKCCGLVSFGLSWERCKSLR